MKKTLYIFLLLIPFSAFAITQKEASVISEIIECKNIISDKDKLDCFEKNIDKIEKAFPIATLGESQRVWRLLVVYACTSHVAFAIHEDSRSAHSGHRK